MLLTTEIKSNKRSFDHIKGKHPGELGGGGGGGGGGGSNLVVECACRVFLPSLLPGGLVVSAVAPGDC